jgi:hypothetical protein
MQLRDVSDYVSRTNQTHNHPQHVAWERSTFGLVALSIDCFRQFDLVQSEGILKYVESICASPFGNVKV